MNEKRGMARMVEEILQWLCWLEANILILLRREKGATATQAAKARDLGQMSAFEPQIGLTYIAKKADKIYVINFLKFRKEPNKIFFKNGVSLI